MNRLVFLLPVVLLMLNACKKDGCNDPLAFNYETDGTSAENCVYEPLNVELSFTTSYGDSNVVTGEDATQLTTDDGRSLQIDYFGIYLTELSFIEDGAAQLIGSASADCRDQEEDVLLLAKGNKTYDGSYLPKPGAGISGIQFNIGIDSCRNYGIDPTTKSSGPFAPKNPTMYWSWASGYRFVSVEGMVDASANADGSDIRKFEYHTGLNTLLRTIQIPLEDLAPEDGKLVVRLNLDFKELLKDVDFTTELSTHTMDNMPLATKITENAVNSFSIAQ